MAFRSRCSKSGAVFGGEGPFGPHLPLSEKKWGLCGAPTVLVDGGYWKGGGEYRGISSLNRQQLYRTTIGFSTANTEFISICLESRCKRVIIGRRADIVDTQNTIYLKCFSVCHQFVMDRCALLLLRFLLTVKKSPVFFNVFRDYNCEAKVQGVVVCAIWNQVHFVAVPTMTLEKHGLRRKLGSSH